MKWKGREQEYKKEYAKEYYKKNKEKLGKYIKGYYIQNKERLDKINKEWREHNKEHNKEYGTKYRKEHQEEIRGIKKDWCRRNPEKVKENSIRGLKIYRKRYPIKTRARRYASYHKQRGLKCLLCLVAEHLTFHHTDYENKMGFTCCIEHHKEQEIFKKEEQINRSIAISCFSDVMGIKYCTSCLNNQTERKEGLK